jgi:decaprenyl-phosphate phosphoribosyltransferase
MPPILRLLRPHQWAKNAFVAAPLFFTPQLISWANLGRVALGVACFSAMASAIYILNDWRDREVDRKHPTKQHRPLAAGTVSVSSAAVAALILTIISATVTLLYLPRGFAIVLAIYVAQNLAYNLWLKQVAILDVLCIAIGFVLRIYAGGQLIGITPTVWIVACTLLLALFLAFAKRRDDLVLGVDDEHRRSLSGYNLPFIDASLAIVLAALVVSYLLYTTQPENMARLHSDKLFLTAPFVIAGVLRYLQVTLVEHRSGSPTRLALTDRFLMITILGWVATFAGLIYG